MKIKEGLKNIFSFSGGKDSTAMILMSIDRGIRIDDVVFFDTGWEFPQLYDHLDLFEKNTGIKITRLRPKKPLDFYMFEYESKLEKYKGMKGYGFPWAMGRYCTREKTAAIKRYNKEQGEYNNFVGFAADEYDRIERKTNVLNKVIAPLAEWGIAEADALKYCYERGYDWGGLYEHFNRVSCWLCPLQKKGNLFKMWNLYPELKQNYVNRARRLEKSRKEAKNNFIKKGLSVPDWCYNPVYAGYHTTIDVLLEQFEKWKIKQNQGLLILD